MTSCGVNCDTILWLFGVDEEAWNIEGERERKSKRERKREKERERVRKGREEENKKRTRRRETMLRKIVENAIFQQLDRT